MLVGWPVHTDFLTGIVASSVRLLGMPVWEVGLNVVV